MRWATIGALVVVGALTLCHSAFSYPCFGRQTLRCRDGAATALFTDNEPAGYHGRTYFHGYFHQSRIDLCDRDHLCNGVCTFPLPGSPTGAFIVPVGKKAPPPPGAGVCPPTYICKHGRRARCRKLAEEAGAT